MNVIGKLSLDSIPYGNLITITAVGGALLAGLIILALITYFRKWPYLYHEWLTSLDHKKIGIMYIILALVMLLRGFADAMLMRGQQSIAVAGNPGFLEPDHFNQIFSAHGSIMIIFMAMPFIVGLWNIAVPQQIGARDVAFPFLNSLSLWLTTAAGTLVMISLGVGEFSKVGWSGYAPLSELQYSPGVGVDYWIWGFQIAGIASTLTGINFLVTIMKMRAPGMRPMLMPMYVWTTFFTCVLIVGAFPVLTAALGMLTLDRYLGMHFFTNTLGGNQMMWVNLFWTWGHPEVYVLILPAFGIFSEVTATFSRKRLFSYVSMVWATAVIMILSFAVWLHHFFTMGASPRVNIVFGIATMMIAIPTGVKIYNWLFTMYRGRIHFSTSMYWTLGFIVTFAVGGASGVMLSIPPADYVLHNSLFLIAHFHNVLLPGALFGLFAGFYYWFPKATGFRLKENWGKRAFWCWCIGFYLAFIPLYVLGFMGMPRRMVTYPNPDWQPYLLVASAGVALILLGIVCIGIQLLLSLKDRQILADRTGDPWDGRTLEWLTSSPPAEYNFAKIPIVDEIDAFWDMKEKGVAYLRPEHYNDIEMPKNTPYGLIIGILAFLFGFGMVWYVWWLAIVTALGMLVMVILRARDDDIHKIIPAAEVQRIENERYRQLAGVNEKFLAGQTVPEPIPET
jgi:cytochrome o ubiquinol oxidase subunit I